TGHSGQPGTGGGRNPGPTVKPMPDYDAAATAAADAALRAGDDEDAPVGLAVFEAPDALHAPPVRPADLCQCGRLRAADRRGVVDISIKLTTLARLDNDP